MDTSGSKLQQKALQQPKQKKSKSAEFLMGEMEESAVVEGIENPVFDGSYSTELSASRASAGREIQRDRQDSTLAAHQQKMELRAPAKPRVSTGNERARNYFDPALVQETNPRRCGMAEVGTEDELELIHLYELAITDSADLDQLRKAVSLQGATIGRHEKLL
ncbi:orofacial cleft 1 candidate gene 1 protein homolog [Salvelinus alpinus]|uniref:orofacial cleft 1 candidate gene 1 protein homolog n=1 Tax=Salvelinus alpinus TaxID=8036 RepID=UPI0039FD14DF